jgi:hypothetical protein
MLAKQMTPEQHANALVLWRAHRMHRARGWCPLCRTPGPCAQSRVTRQALVEAGVLAPAVALQQWENRRAHP